MTRENRLKNISYILIFLTSIIVLIVFKNEFPYIYLYLRQLDFSTIASLGLGFLALLIGAYQIYLQILGAREAKNKDTEDKISNEIIEQKKEMTQYIRLIDERVNKRIDDMETQNEYIRGLLDEILLKFRVHQELPGHDKSMNILYEIIKSHAELKALITLWNSYITKVDKVEIEGDQHGMGT